MRTRVRDLDRISLSRVEESCGWLGRGRVEPAEREDFHDDQPPLEQATMARDEDHTRLAV
jgi:hypothetical protein